MAYLEIQGIKVEQQPKNPTDVDFVNDLMKNPNFFIMEQDGEAYEFLIVDTHLIKVKNIAGAEFSYGDDGRRVIGDILKDLYQGHNCKIYKKQTEI